jgi:hypothetical protein
MVGGLMQLVAASGYEDLILTNNPEITFWKTIYRRPTNFSSEFVRLNFDSIMNFGTKTSCILKKNGDLLHRLYLCIKLPDLISFYPNTIDIDIQNLFKKFKIYVKDGQRVGKIIFDDINNSITIDVNFGIINREDYLEIVKIIKDKLTTFIDYEDFIKDIETIFEKLVESDLIVNNIDPVVDYVIKTIDEKYKINDTFYEFIYSQLTFDTVNKYILNYQGILNYYTYNTLLTNIFPSYNSLFTYMLGFNKFNTSIKSFLNISYMNSYIISSLLKYHNNLNILNNTTAIEYDNIKKYINNQLTFNITGYEDKTLDDLYKIVNKSNNSDSLLMLQNIFIDRNIIPARFCEFDHLYRRVFKNNAIPASSTLDYVNGNLNYHIYNNYSIIFNLVKSLLFNYPIVFCKMFPLSENFSDEINVNNYYNETNQKLNTLNKITTCIHACAFNDAYFNPICSKTSKITLIDQNQLDKNIGLKNNASDVDFNIYNINRTYGNAYNSIIDNLDGVADINDRYNDTTLYSHFKWIFNTNNIFKEQSFIVTNNVVDIKPKTQIINNTTVPIDLLTDARSMFYYMVPKQTTDVRITKNTTDPIVDNEWSQFDKSIFLGLYPIDQETIDVLNPNMRSLDTLQSYETMIKYLTALSEEVSLFKNNPDIQIQQYPYHDILIDNVTNIPVFTDKIYNEKYVDTLNEIKDIPFENDLLDAINKKIKLFVNKMELEIEKVYDNQKYNNLFKNNKIWFENVIPVDINAVNQQIKQEYFNYNINVSIIDTYKYIHSIHMSLLDRIKIQPNINSTNTPLLNSLITKMLENFKIQYERLYEIRYKMFILKIFSHYNNDLQYIPTMPGYKGLSKFMYIFKKEQFIDLDYIIKDFVQLIKDIRFPTIRDIPEDGTLMTNEREEQFKLLLSFCEVKKQLYNYCYFAQLKLMEPFEEYNGNVVYPVTPIYVTDIVNTEVNETLEYSVDYNAITFRDDYTNHIYNTISYNDKTSEHNCTDRQILWTIENPLIYPTIDELPENLKLSFVFNINYKLIKGFNDLMNGILDSSFLTESYIKSQDLMYNTKLMTTDTMVPTDELLNINNENILFNEENLMTNGTKSGFILKNVGYETDTNMRKILTHIDDNVEKYNIDDRQFITLRAQELQNNDVTNIVINKIGATENLKLLNTVSNFEINPTLTPLQQITINNKTNIQIEINTTIPLNRRYLDYYRLNKNIIYNFDSDGVNNFSDDLTYFDFLSKDFVDELSLELKTVFNNEYSEKMIIETKSTINYNNTFLKTLSLIINKYVLSNNLYLFFKDMLKDYNESLLMVSPLIFKNLEEIKNDWIFRASKYINNNLLTGGINDMFATGTINDTFNNLSQLVLTPIQYNNTLSQKYLIWPNMKPLLNVLTAITPTTLFKDADLIIQQFNNFRQKKNYIYYILYQLTNKYLKFNIFEDIIKNQNLNLSYIKNSIITNLRKSVNIKLQYYDKIIYIENEIKNIINRLKNPRNAWIKRLGHFMIEYATIESGGQRVDIQYGDWMNIWYELTKKDGHERGYDIMIGDIPELTTFDNSIKKGKLLYIPFYFWFCKHHGLSLPLVALQYQELKLTVKLRDFSDCCYYDKYSSFLDPSAIYLYASIYKTLYNVVLKNEDIKFVENELLHGVTDISKHINNPKINDAYILAEYIYLDNEEREIFARNKHEYLIEQIQYNGDMMVPSVSESSYGVQYLDENLDNVITDIDNTNEIKFTKIEIPLTFINPIKAMFFVVRMQKHVQRNDINSSNDEYYEGEKQWYNYGLNSFRKKDNLANINSNNINPIEYATIRFNGKNRLDEFTPGFYFNYIQPYQHCNHSPQVGLNMYSFAFKPMEFDPQGTCNMSKIDDAKLILYLNKLINNKNAASILIFSLGYNIWRVMSGLSGLAFVIK